MSNPYRYYILLSGQDYPLKSTKYIHQFLTENYPRPFIDIDRYEDYRWIRSKFQIVRWSHKIENVHTQYNSGIIRKLHVAPLVVSEFIENKFYGSPFTRLQHLGVTLYGGSQWWILPDVAVNEIIKDLTQHPKIIKEYKRTWTPEETFFQTMVMRTSVSDFVEFIPKEKKIHLSSMTYANFCTPNKGFCGHPHIITMEEIDYILSGKQLFARKFDQDVDSNVLDYIDQYRADTDNDNLNYKYFVPNNGQWKN